MFCMGNCESRNAGTWNRTQNGSNVVYTGNYTEMTQEVTINGKLPSKLLCVLNSTSIMVYGSTPYVGMARKK